MPHPRGKRSLRSKQLRDAKHFIQDKSFRDRQQAESVNILPISIVKEYIASLKQKNKNAPKYPSMEIYERDFEKGEVIVDSRGRGSFQR